MTYLILRAYTGTVVSHSQRRKKSEKSGEVLGKMQVNGPEGKRYPRKKFLAVSVAGIKAVSEKMYSLVEHLQCTAD